MAAKKLPAPKKMVLKKTTTKKPAKVFPYSVRIGTRNELGPVHTYATEPAARTAIIAAFNEWNGWCARHNQRGLVAIDEAKGKVGSLTFNARPNRLECCFDEMYAMWVVAEFWKTQ